MPEISLTVCYDTCQIRTLSHGAVTGGPFEQFQTLTGGTSGAVAEIVGVNASDVVVLVSSGEFEDGETVTQSGGSSDGANAVLDAPPAMATNSVILHDDQRYYETGRGSVRAVNLVVDDLVKLFTDQAPFRIVSIP